MQIFYRKCHFLHIPKLKGQRNLVEYKIYLVKYSIKHTLHAHPPHVIQYIQEKIDMCYWRINNLGEIFLTSLLNPLSNNTIKAFVNLTKTEWIIRMTINFLA